MTSTLESDLIDLIAEQSLTERDKLTREATLQSIGIDSVDVVSVAFELEEKYEIQIEDKEFAACETLGQLLDLIQNKITKKAEKK